MNNPDMITLADIEEKLKLLDNNESAPGQKYMSFEEQLRSYEKLETIATPKSIPQEEQLNSPYIKAAAVMIFYDPLSLKPLQTQVPISDEEKKTMINQLIGQSEMVFNYGNEFIPAPIENENTSLDISQDEISGRKLTKLDQRISYYLKDEVRKEVLKKLFAEDTVQDALDANSDITYKEDSLLQHIFTQCLLGNTPDVEKARLQELNALQRVNDWLSSSFELDFVEAAKKIIGQRIEMTEMLSPFKHLTGKYDKGEFIEQFRGRKDELAILRKYVGVAPPQGALEYIERQVKNYLDTNKRSPLLLFGLGGVGKSTLLAKFILEHAEAHEKDRFPFVYLDFDKQCLSALAPETLLVEASRQLSIQYIDTPDLYSSFLDFFDRWKNKDFIVLEEKNTSSIMINADKDSIRYRHDRNEIIYDFIAVIKKLSKTEQKPFLIVLDTFEEVQYKGQETVKQLYGFMQLIQDEYPLLRLVVAGRAPVLEIKTQELELGDLDKEATIAFLEKTGINDKTLAKKIADKVGGNPLTLKLAAELVKNYGAEELTQINLSKKKLFFFEERLSQIEIQGILYRRILNHIHDPEVLKLAHPGLVLREITADLILKVLAKPCDLKVNSSADAEVLFKEIGREVSLITRVNATTLRHRPDVRKMMLRLIKEDDPTLVDEIHTAAVKYYSGKDDVKSRAEEFYHRLCLNESPRSLDARWIDGIQDHILNSIDELPPKAQAYLSARTGIEVNDATIWEDADVEDRERRVIRSAASMLNSGQSHKVLDIIDSSDIDITKSGVLSLFKVRAFMQIEMYDQALQTANQILNSFYANEVDSKIKIELIKCVDMIRNKQDENKDEPVGPDNNKVDVDNAQPYPEAESPPPMPYIEDNPQPYPNDRKEDMDGPDAFELTV